jgi:hypothetical protein
LNELDIYRAAQAAIAAYGEAAVLHATQRADELLAAGDMVGRRTWHRIEAAIVDLQRTEPDRMEDVY